MERILYDGYFGEYFDPFFELLKALDVFTLKLITVSKDIRTNIRKKEKGMIATVLYKLNNNLRILYILFIFKLQNSKFKLFLFFLYDNNIIY